MKTRIKINMFRLTLTNFQPSERPFANTRRLSSMREAFTLIELLVVIAIISLLVSILMPSLRTARELAQRAVCATNLKSMGLAVGLYTEDNQASVSIEYNPWMWKSNYWQGQLAPYFGKEGSVESDFVYASYSGGPVANNPKYPDVLIAGFQCPTSFVKDYNYIWGNSYGINQYLWSTYDPSRYWDPTDLNTPDSTFLIMDCVNYIVGDPWGAEKGAVHPEYTKNVLFCDFHVAVGYQDPSEKTFPEDIIGWYDEILWGDSIAGWCY